MGSNIFCETVISEMGFPSASFIDSHNLVPKRLGMPLIFAQKTHRASRPWFVFDGDLNGEIFAGRILGYIKWDIYYNLITSYLIIVTNPN